MIDPLTVRVRDLQKAKDPEGHNLEAVCHKP